MLAAGVFSRVVCTLLTVTWVVFLARVLWSWFPAPRGGPLRTVYDLLIEVTDPILRPLRKAFPPIPAGAMAVDVSIIIVFVIVLVLQQALCS